MYLYGEMHGLIPLFTSWAGVGVAEIPVQHRCRQHGGLHCGKDQEPGPLPAIANDPESRVQRAPPLTLRLSLPGLPLKVAFRQSCRYPGQQDQGNEVGESYQSQRHVPQCPYG